MELPLRSQKARAVTRGAVRGMKEEASVICAEVGAKGMALAQSEF